MTRYENTVLNQVGRPISGATISIFLTGTVTPATIYSDDGVTPKANPFTTDSLGRFSFFVADGKYAIEVSGTGITTYTLADIEIADVSERNAADADWKIGTATVNTVNFDNTSSDITLSRVAANILATGSGDSFAADTLLLDRTNRDVSLTRSAANALQLATGDKFLAQNINSIRYANEFAGADAGAKITAALADLPSTGGTIDARGFEGAQTIASTITISKPATILLGNATFTFTGAAPAFSIQSDAVGIIGTQPDNTNGTYIDFTPSGYSHPATARDARAAIEMSLVAGGTRPPFFLRIENLYIRVRQNAGQAGIKWRASYSVLRNVQVDIDGYDGAASRPASGLLFLGDQVNGSGSYYNYIEQFSCSGRSSATGATDEICIRFETDTAAGTRYPNANIITSGRQAGASHAIHVRGSGNSFYGVVSETIRTAHYRFGVTGAVDTVGNKVWGAYAEQSGTATGFLFETSSSNNYAQPSYLTGLSANFTDSAAITANNQWFYDHYLGRRLIVGGATSAGGTANTRFWVGNLDSGARTSLAVDTTDTNNVDIQSYGAGGGTGILRLNPLANEIHLSVTGTNTDVKGGLIVRQLAQLTAGATITGATVTVPSITSGNADAADAGFIRLANAEQIVWEASPAGTDVVGMDVDANEVVRIGPTGASAITAGVKLNAPRLHGSGTALVAGDFALSAGWGTTAAVSAVIGSDLGWQATVTSSGTGQGANPTLTLTFKDGTFTNAPICISKMVGGTGTVTNLTEAPTATTNVITFNSTPVAASTYIIAGHTIGR